MKIQFPPVAAGVFLPLAALLGGAYVIPLASAPQVSERPGEARFQQPGQDFPGGRRQRDMILKAEHQENLKDASRLVELSEQLRRDLEESNGYSLPVEALKKTDEIEKLAKRIRTRIRH